MAWAYVQKGTVSAWAATNANLSVAYPATPGVGNHIFLIVASALYNHNTSGMAPAGFTFLASRGEISLFAKIATGSESGSVTITASGGDGSTAWIGQMAEFSGGLADLGSIVHSNAGANHAAPTATLDFPDSNESWTVTVDNTLLISGGTQAANQTAYSSRSPTSYSVIETAFTSTPAGASFGWAYEIQTTARAFGTGEAITWSGTTAARSLSLGVSLLESGLTKYLKVLTHPDAVSATGVEGAVHSAPSGSDYVTGTTRYGSFTGKAFSGTQEAGQAVLKVLASDCGVSGLAVGATPVVCVRTTANTTGVISAIIIEE